VPEKVEGNIAIMLIPNILQSTPVYVLSKAYYNFYIADCKETLCKFFQGNPKKLRKN